MDKERHMNMSCGQDIVQRLIDNATAIIAASTGGETAQLAALARRQQTLTRALAENTAHTAISRPAIAGLQDLVAKAMEVVRIEMGQNRGSMQAAGIKKKVLRAYGTVTVSETSSR